MRNSTARVHLVACCLALPETGSVSLDDAGGLRDRQVAGQMELTAMRPMCWSFLHQATVSRGEIPVSTDQRSFWGSQWTVAIIGGAVAAVIGGIILAAITSGHTAGSPGPASTPSSLEPRASTPASKPTTAAGGIYHQGSLDLAYNGCADLDAPPSDPQWGELSASSGAGGADLCSQYPYFSATNNASLVAVSSGATTTCQNATGWISSNSYQDLNLSVGSFMCVHTNQNRYSLLRVASVNSANNSIVFSVKTFKKPGDPAASSGNGISGSSIPAGIYHQGRLDLTYNGCADLDAPPSDPQWGELSASSGGGGADLCSQYPYFSATNNASLVAVSSGGSTTCQDATGWIASNSSQDFNLSVGSFICVHTNQSRYSLLRVVSINSSNSSIVFSVKTFKKPGD